MNHLNAITAQLDAYQLDALCITSQPGEYYAVGLKGEGVVLVTRQGCHYFTDSRYIELAQNTVTNADVTMVTPHQDHLALASLVLEHYGLKRVGIEEAYLTVERWQKMKTAFPADTELVPAGKLLTELRSAKTEEELAVMQKAQDITDQVFAEICEFLHAGVTESEVAAQLTYLQMKHGAEGNSFPPIVASGANNTLYDGVANGVGFTSITVAWLSQLNAFAMIVISALLAILEKGAETLQTAMQVPTSISDIVTGILLFCMLGCEFFINYRMIFRRKQTEAPAAPAAAESDQTESKEDASC